MAVSITPLSENIGAEVTGVDFSQPLPAAELAETDGQAHPTTDGLGDSAALEMLRQRATASRPSPRSFAVRDPSGGP